LATITNLIQTVFNSSGVNTVTRDINTLSRNQTRLGQASASAGRAFSAQASGLGGLVAAYAGAAATTFALQQAFDKLAKSAQALQTLQGLNTLAAESAISGQALVKSIQDITKGQLTLFEAAAQTNLALSAGFDSKQIEGLASVAIKASRALGRDLTDAMTRVVRGSAKMETELLDELGIYTKIEPATRAYAAAMGKAVGELTEYERRQAFVNSVIDEGTRKFSAINTTVPTAAESIEAFGAKMVELSTIFLGFLAEGVAPLADFLTNNFAASLGAVGAILALVASKGVALLNAAFINLAASALASGRVAENKARILFGLADAARTATSAIAGLNLATFRGTQAEKTQIAALQNSAKARALTRAELIQSQKLIQNNITSLNAERAAYRDNIRAAAIARGELERARAMPRGPVRGDLSDPTERARNAAIRAANIQIAATRPAAIAAVQALPALRAQLTQLETAFAATATAATGARAAIAGFATTVATGLSVAISRLGILAGLVLGAASKILFVVTVVQLFGSAIANFLGKGEEFESFFKNLGKTISSALGITQARELKQAITGIVGGSLSELEKANSELTKLDKFTFSQSKFLGIKIEVEKTKEEVVKEVTGILQEVANPVEKTVFTVATDAVKGALSGAALGFITGGPKGAIVGAISAGVISGVLSAFTSSAVDSAVKEFGDSVRAEFAGAFTDLNLDTGSQDAAVRAISVLRDRYGAIASVDPQARAFLKLNEQLVIESVKYVKNIELVSSVMAATGQTADTVSKNLNFDTALPQIEGIKKAITTISGIDLVVAVQTDEAEKKFQSTLLDLNSRIVSTRKLLIDFGIPKENLNAIFDAIDKFGLTKLESELTSVNSTFFETEIISREVVQGLQMLIGNQERFKDFSGGLSDSIKSFNILKGSVDNAGSSLLRAGEVLRAVEQGISTNSLSLEQFEQKINSASSAIVIAEQALISANKQQQALSKLLSDVTISDETRESLEEQYNLLEDQRKTLLSNLPLYKEIYALQKQQEESLKSQIQLTEFIREQTPKSANVLSVALESYTKNTEFAQAKTIEFVQTLANSGISEGNIYRQNIERADRLNLSLEQRTQLLGATVGTAKTIVSNLNKQEGIVAELKDGYIDIRTILADGTVSANQEIVLQQTEQLSLAQQNVDLTALQAKLAEKLIFDSISLLSNQDAYLTKLKETNSLKQRELELSLAIANEESRKIQSALEIGRVELTVDSAKQSLEIERARLEIADLQADTATKALERQIMLQENLNDRREQQLSREIESQERVLAILQRQGEARELLVSIATPLDKQGSNEAAIFREQLNNRAQVLAQETVLLELQEKQARESLAGQMEVARLQKSQAAAELRTALDRIKPQKNIIDMELSLFKQEQAFAKQQLDEQIAANANQILLNEQQSQLRKDQLANEQKLELKKATGAANQLLEQIKVINLEDAVFTKFTENLNKIVTQLTGQGVSDLVKAPADRDDLSKSLTTFKQSIESSYSVLFVQQDLFLAKELSNNANRLANEQELLKGKAESLREYQKRALEVAEQRAAAEKAALDESLEAAKAAYTEQLARSVDLTNSQLDIDREYNDNRNALLEQFAISVLQEYEKVQKAGQQLVLDFANQVKSIQRETEALKQEAITIRVKADFDAKQAASQLQQQIAEADISRMQAKIRLVDARADIKEIPAIEAAKQVNDLQMKILAKQEEVERIRFAREDAQLVQEQIAALEQLARTKAEIEARRDIAIQEARARQQAVAAQATTLAKFLIENASVWNAAIERLRQVLQTGASSIGLAIASQGTQVGAVTSGGAIAASVGGLVSVVSQSQAAFEGLKTTITENAAAAAAAEEEKTRAFFLNKGREREALRQAHEDTLENIGIQKQTEDALAKKRIQDASAGSDKQKEKLKELQKDYESAIEKIKDSLIGIFQELLSTIGSIVVKNLEKRVEQAKVKEAIVTTNLAAATERLTEAQTKQQDLVNKELSLREEIKESFKRLAEVQKDYVDSLTGDDRSIKESSKILIETILDQKRKQLDLSKTINSRIRQDTLVKSLETRKIEQERKLEEATYARLEAEKQLEEMQTLLSQLSSILSGEMFKLSTSLQNFGQSVKALRDVLNKGVGAGFSQNQLAGSLQGFGNNLVNNLLFGAGSGGGILNNAINGLVNAGKVLSNAGSAIATSVGNAGVLSSPRPVRNPIYTSGAGGASGVAGGFWNTVGGAIGAGFQGFGIGSIVGAITKDPGMGSSIGGAIGGALATLFPSIILSAPILGSIATGIAGSALGATLGATIGSVVPVIGTIIGALIGRLFSRTPQAGATGELTEKGFTITSQYETKVAAGTAESLADLAGGTLTGVVDTLKSIGVEFKDIVTTSIGLRESAITGASLAFEGGQSFSRGGSGTSQKDLEDTANFYLTSFIQGLRKGSLVVDSTVASAAELQAAIDKFVASNSTEKTIERLQYVLEFAAGFSKILEDLGEAIPVTMKDALAQVSAAAKANADSIAQQYSALQASTADVFGRTSAQYALLNEKIKANALAQLGLAVGTDGVLRSVTKAAEQLNAGTLAVANIIEAITAFDVALEQAGFSALQAADIINFALNTQITEFIGAIGDSLQNSIDVLKNPAVQAAIELEAIIENAAERTKQAEGVLAGIRSYAGRLEQTNLDTAIENVSKTIELGALEVKAYLESLNIEQLKAVVADEDRIDSTTRLAAETRLAKLQEDDRVKATQKFIKISREFNKGLSEITKTSALPEFLGLAVSSFELAQILGKTEIDNFSIGLSETINSIAKGKDILGNFESVISSLNSEYAQGSISASQLTEVLDILQDTTIDSINVYNDLVSAVGETAQEILDI
jgi:hypothetical protein